MEVIEGFVSEGFELIDTWKTLKNNIVSKTKTINENMTSIDTLERNLGSDNKFVKVLRETIGKIKIDDELNEFSIVENKIKVLKDNCVKSLGSMLELYNKLCKETSFECEKSENSKDPIGVEAAKLLWGVRGPPTWGKVDNLQLRSDPPIMGIHKDEFRKNLVAEKDNSMDGSSLDKFFVDPILKT